MSSVGHPVSPYEPYTQVDVEDLALCLLDGRQNFLVELVDPCLHLQSPSTEHEKGHQFTVITSDRELGEG